MMFNYLPATRRIPWARTLRRESSGSGSDSWCGLVKAESSNIVQEGRKEVWSVMTVFVFVWLWHKLTNQKEKTQKGRPMTRLSFIMVQKRWLRWLSLFFDAESNRAAHKCTTTLTQKGQPMTRLSFYAGDNIMAIWWMKQNRFESSDVRQKSQPMARLLASAVKNKSWIFTSLQVGKRQDSVRLNHKCKCFIEI